MIRNGSTSQAEIASMVDRYGDFEQRVQRQMEQRCQPACSVCRHVCCRPHFCEESRQSAFLERVVRRFSPQAVFDKKRGWLSPKGCTLVAGRPPVCYEFLCGDIPDAVSADSHRRWAMLALSMLVTHVGRRAVGSRHLVEATGAGELTRIHRERFAARLEEAEAALAEAAAILDGRRTTAAGPTLARIVPPPGRKPKRRSM
ncbi:hypothetical protein DSCW_23510 [Desulfosarcina widdelii]|uniref:Uncharacterized protein n=1 Tax=Desulfosarcina widdelii TaxID=947919 RepID=A0A5K7Z8Z8_9BACT|nr:hypothetical protein [Desulfosarcina widdelii]BBO74934.1 hypothetical protein DSCW_23510 [Desulfosarcina widdelii]